MYGVRHPLAKEGKGAVHRKRPDGVVEYFTDAGWITGGNCDECIGKALYPVANYADTWAEPVNV
jgi:hypothetical protein